MKKSRREYTSLFFGIVVGFVLTRAGVYMHQHVTFTQVFSSTHPVEATEKDDTDEQDSHHTESQAAVTLAVPGSKVQYTIASDTPQFVILSFDGSKSVPMLHETLAFEKKLQDEHKPLHFTYFINAAYFLTNQTAKLYHPPVGPAGVSIIGFSNTAPDIAERVTAFNDAHALGNEIGSHSVGHFDGTSWSYDEWKKEFDSFTSLMAAVQKNNPSTTIDTPTFLDSIRGFRAPVLGVNKHVYKVLADSHFLYDASGITPADAWPTNDTNGIWHIPLSMVLMGPKKSPVVAMDYNLWFYQSNGKNRAVQGTPLWNEYVSDIQTAYKNLFTAHYNGNRGPIVIGNHFTKWNDGVYFEAMKNFAEEVCGQPQVRCVTFSELVEYLNTTGAPRIAR